MISTRDLVSFHANKLLNLEYGDFWQNWSNANSLQSLRNKHRDEMRELESRSIVPDHLRNLHQKFIRDGSCYIGNISEHPKFKLIESYTTELLEEPTTRWGPETTMALSKRDGLKTSEPRLFAFPPITCRIDRQPSFTTRPELYLPQVLLDRISIATGIPYRWGALLGWKQLTVPHRPRIHRDGMVYGAVKAFILMEDVDMAKGPTKVYTRLQSRIISILRQPHHRKIVPSCEGHSGIFLFNFKPMRFAGKRGDVFIFDPNNCLHAEGELETRKSRVLAEAVAWPACMPKSIIPYIEKPISP